MTNDLLWLRVIILATIMIIIVLLPLAFLLRSTKLIANIKLMVKKFWRKITALFVASEKIYIALIIAIACQIVVVAQTSQVYEMGSAENRYLMYIYPLVTLLIGVVVYDLVRLIRKRKVAIVSLVVVLTGVFVINVVTRQRDTDYYFKENIKGTPIEQVVENKDSIFIGSENWSIVYMTPVLLDSKKYFQTSMGKYNSYVKEYEDVNKNEVVLIVDVTRLKSTIGIAKMAENGDEVLKKVQKEFDDVLQFYREVYSADTVEKVSEQTVFGRAMEAYVFR